MPFEHSSHGLLPLNRSTGAISPSGRLEVYHPEGDEFRLSLPLQTIEDRVQGTLTIEQG